MKNIILLTDEEAKTCCHYNNHLAGPFGKNVLYELFNINPDEKFDKTISLDFSIDTKCKEIEYFNVDMQPYTVIYYKKYWMLYREFVLLNAFLNNFKQLSDLEITYVQAIGSDTYTMWVSVKLDTQKNQMCYEKM